MNLERVMRHLIILFIPALWIVNPALAQGFGSVRGIVITAESQPVAGADVRIANNSNDFIIAQTDDDGAFAFDSVQIGKHRITAALAGMGKAIIDIEVVVGAETVVGLSLQMKPPG